MAFLVFEGLDGAGKSTLISGVENHLKALGQKVHLTREPGGTPLGEEIRQQLLRVEGDTPVPRAEMLLYEAARAQHVDRVIRPGLAEGKWILCDRFAPSTVAFQVGGRGLDRTAIDYLNSYATDGLLPDLVVLVDLPVEESLARMAKREEKTGQEKDRFEREERRFHEGVRASYLQQAKEDEQRWLVLDGMKNPEDLLQALLMEMEKRGWLASLTK
ncbi:MAG: dTMP kinase [Bdellovibrionaceae bacterium]|nr:dTMP kinase [Bdellovibrionales bacterium]MCB9085833.1 dTMP kinase [Pseudobdellovibrionaceae bacterium]